MNVQHNILFRESEMKIKKLVSLNEPLHLVKNAFI